MKTKTVLVVDDSAALRHIASQVLCEAGYQVLLAEDGMAALQQLDGRKVDLVITDIYMPNLDGLTLIGRIKQITAYRFTPIMILSREAADGPRFQAQVAGAKAWIVKPFVAAQLLQAVAKIVG